MKPTTFASIFLGAALLIGCTSQNVGNSIPTPGEDQPQQETQEISWKTMAYPSLGIKLQVLPEFKEENLDAVSVSLNYWGATQTTGTEMFDGMHLYFQKWGGDDAAVKNADLNSVAQYYWGQSAYATIELELTTLNNLPAYHYKIEGLGTSDAYIFENQKGAFIYMDASSADPQNKGYAEIMEQIIASITLL